MPRNLKDEIDMIITDVGQQVKDLASASALRAPADTVRVEHALAFFGRQLADRVMELMLRSAVEEPERADNSGEAASATSASERPASSTRAAGQRETPVLLLGGRKIRVRTITYRFAELALALRSERMAEQGQAPQGSGALAGKRVVASVDGGRIRIRERARGGCRRKETRHRSFKAPWREPKVLTVYSIDEKGRKERRRVSLTDGTLKDADVIFALLVGHLRLLGAHEADAFVLIGDGARWIWNRVQALFEAVGLPAHRCVAIVDFYHALEHLQHVADLRAGWSAAERRSWFRRAKKALRAGRVERVIADIDELCVGRRAKAIATERKYFVKNMESVRYRDFERRGLPIGSGAVESAVRRVVNQRLKGNGCCWLEPHAEGILHLRGNLKAGRWDQLVHEVLDHHTRRRA
ncbi:MAG: hypothetical protein HY849_01830 [Nitrosomonadales bacterium]|nr:hypothetical protein [Nitrosomonadales bacterium]